MPRRSSSRANKDEITRVFFGIDPKTNTVDRVTATRGGKLTRYKNQRFYTHQTHSGYSVDQEVRIVFELDDIFDTIPQLENSESVKAQIEELQTKLKKNR